MLNIVVDTNLWMRVLLGGRITLPLIEAWQQRQFQLTCSEPLIAELDAVWRRPRFRDRIHTQDAQDLIDRPRQRSIMVELKTVPPRCRDVKDDPVLATAIDGLVDAIVTGDGDLRADDELREAMSRYGVELWGINTLLERLGE